MILSMSLRNFRSIREQNVRIAPMTVVYGPNGAGKSSLIYALLTLKNIVLNPNQPVDAFFNYGWLNLGGFKQVVFGHDERTPVALGVERAVTWPDGLDRDTSYSVTLWPGRGAFRLRAGQAIHADLRLEVSFPHPASMLLRTKWEQYDAISHWNGIFARLEQRPGAPLLDGAEDRLNNLNVALNTLPATVASAQAVPLRRGFFKPSYGMVPLTPVAVNEDEMATYLANEKYLRDEVSAYLEEIVERRFSVNVTPGTALFSLDCFDARRKVSTELVSEGFGTNQLVYLLTVALRKDASVVCIEEPEVHLHPTAIRRLARALSTIAKEKNRSFVISTHSEQFVLALLAMVKEGKLGHDEVACYLATKRDRETRFERQPVEPTGQIKGGLSSFLEGEMEDLRTFLGVAENGGEASDVKPPDRAE